MTTNHLKTEVYLTSETSCTSHIPCTMGNVLTPVIQWLAYQPSIQNTPGSVGKIQTRPQRSALWSTLTFKKCSSRRMWSETSVTSRVFHAFRSQATLTKLVPTMDNVQLHYCATMVSNNGIPIDVQNATERHGRFQTVLFNDATAHRIFKRNKTHCRYNKHCWRNTAERTAETYLEIISTRYSFKEQLGTEQEVKLTPETAASDTENVGRGYGTERQAGSKSRWQE
jgi:hypothetical protein